VVILATILFFSNINITLSLWEQLMRIPAVYMMTSKKNGVIYTGVTSNLAQRVYQHKMQVIECFTKKYNCKLLVFYEIYDGMAYAIAREKIIKGGSRRKKIALIESMNPDWNDLYHSIL
jgi:predicted GIY-YIG superfamily endonuclease